MAWVSSELLDTSQHACHGQENMGRPPYSIYGSSRVKAIETEGQFMAVQRGNVWLCPINRQPFMGKVIAIHWYKQSKTVSDKQVVSNIHPYFNTISILFMVGDVHYSAVHQMWPNSLLTRMQPLEKIHFVGMISVAATDQPLLVCLRIGCPKILTLTLWLCQNRYWKCPI